MIKLECPHCEKLLNIPDKYATQIGTCKHCNGRIVAPIAPEPETDPNLSDKELRKRRRLMAKTEKMIARTRKHIADSTRRVLAPGVKWKAWLTVADSKVCREICQKNQAQGFIPLDEPFVSGHTMSPGHHDCRCAMVTFSDEPSDASKAIVQRKIEETERAMMEVEPATGLK